MIDGIRFDWEQGDTFVVPNWAYHEHLNPAPDPDEDAVLFSASDRPLFDAFGWYREQEYAENAGHQPISSVFDPME